MKGNIVLCCIIILLLIILIYLIKVRNENREMFSNLATEFVPKIIHQTAPADLSKWPKTWKICQKSWKEKFPESEYKHIMWTDEDLNNFVRKNYPDFYPIYKDYNSNIRRIDTARYLILHKMGGIYADMDYFCNQNFYNKVNVPRVSIVESPYKHNEHLQNSLMASPKGLDYWLNVIDEARVRKDMASTLSATGPRLIDKVYNMNKKAVNVLDSHHYNPHIENPEFNSKDNITKHYLTSVWEKNRGLGKNKRDKMFENL